MADADKTVKIEPEPVSDAFEKKLIEEPAEKQSMVEVSNAAMQPQSDLQKLQAELSAAAMQSKKYERERQEESGADVTEQQVSSDNMEVMSQKQMEREKAEQEAMEKVRAAEKVGEEIGAKAAADLIQRQKGQSKEQNDAQVKALKKKLGETSEQVSSIIENFEKVHKEMLELRQQESEDEDS